ncbi:unnamed protein product [Spirodela intermedia]|uniref:PHD-type domain-containing protein n=1 Tax=Spirodela intermedia TaxID=51605 RepID=A0A7I8JKI2_SPIIN|nr:unnamed protein product [Spirodela intermedia]CAA6670639.1 unnamed protein product [Spirodela intermedia]
MHTLFFVPQMVIGLIRWLMLLVYLGLTSKVTSMDLGLPVQFADFFISSLGEVDQRPAYHDTRHIWPIGYTCQWHDKITGSLFESEVADGGDSGPVFKVKRRPCSLLPIGDGRIVLSPSVLAPLEGSALEDFSDNDSTQIQMLVSEPDPFQQDFLAGHSENPLKNEIGEFHVQGRSSSAVWRKVSQTLINLCHEVYSHSGNLKLCCTHAVCGIFLRFGPRQVPKVINCESQLEASCESLATWLEHDRFGLDMDFAQEIIERLPGALGCRKYKFLTKRSCYPTSKTVGSGFLSAKGQAMEQYAEEVALSTSKHFPPGRPLDSRFPLELVGDVVQIWEFLWRFFEILGLGEPISFNELEEELIDPWPIVTDRLETFEKEIQETRELSSHSREIAVSGQRTPLFIQVETGPMREASLAKMASCTYGRCTGNVLAKVHMSLLKVLVGELLSKVSVFADPSFDPGESKSRRGRKRDVDNSLQAKKATIDILPLNALSWPELARRYILAVLSTDRSLESSEISCRDGLKIFRCIHGDGGVLCGSLAGVAGMEADALLLAEAYKQISDPLRRENDAWPVEDKDPAVVSLAEPPVNNGLGTPEWAQLLEPVRKLPTNVGTRIRKCIYDSLEKDPPDWARKILEHSISKEVYKGNASGPTKKAVLSVLEAVSGGNLHSKPIKGRKTKHNEPKSDVIMKQCRIVLRQAAAADEDKVFCNLLGSSMSNPNDNDDEGILGFPAMVSRPLDFRTIDLRLAVGAYGGSHEVFVEDVREVWHNIYMAYGDRPDLMELAESLSKNFESLYEKQVLSLVKNFADDTSVGCSNDEATRNRNDLHHANEVPRAPWEEGVCKVCGIDKDDDSVLLCDSCDSEYHTYCLNPPLSKIPDGNWYCPSCVVVQCKNQGSSPSSQGTGRQEHRYLGEYSSMFHEVLNQLVTSMEKREYWELSIEERTFLLKFLCDEVLSSALIREQLEQSVDTSNELQQKIRLIVVEWRNLKFKEDLLIRTSKEISGKVNGTSESLRDEGTANVIATDGKLMGQEHHFSNRSDCQIFVTEENGQIDMNKQVNELFCKRFVFDKHSNANGTRSSSLNEFSDPKVSCDERNNDGLSLKNDILRLEESFAVLESQLLMSTLRRDFLGRDSFGRMYWSIVRPCKRPWLLVDGNTSAQQNEDYGGPFIGSAGDASKKDACNVRTCASRSSNSGPKDDTRNSYRLVLYESDQEIHELVCSLRESDPRERELKEGIVQLQRLGSHHVSSDTQVISRPSGMDRVAPPQLLTKAAILLESKYGPCLEPESNDGSRKRARKCKNFEERMRRCECLEPIWPSRHHCLQCHQTFGTRLELEKHTDERCANRVPPGENKESGDSVKGKMGRSDSNYQKESLDETDLIGESRSAVDITPRLPHFQNQLCPHDFKEISRRFIPKGAIKDLVQEIGLIGSNGIPSFIQPDPQSFLDPSLVLVKNEGSDVVLISAEGMAEGDARIESDDTLEQCRKTPGDADYMEIMEISSMPARLNNTLNGSCKDNVSVPGINHTCIVPESSLRPLGGKVSQILKQLKINLLDMDATLPEEALRPLQALSGKRRAWRSLVKSAESIYQMVQATILLEGMIKTDYLKSGWWYWSSLTTAAKTVTISSLALRIYALDASIVYAKTASDPGMAESVKATLSRAGRKKKDMDGGA